MDELAKTLERIRASVEEKRAAGLYPPGLEQQLEYEFNEILMSETEGHGDAIQAIKRLVLDKLAVVDHLSLMIVELESRIIELEQSRRS